MTRSRLTRRAATVTAIMLAAMSVLAAFGTFNSHVMSGGVQGRQYWLDGSIGSVLASEIYSAKFLWGNSTSLVSLAETPTKAAAEIERYQPSQGSDYCGRAILYDNFTPTEVNPYTENWDYAKVLVSPYIGAGGFCPNYRGILVHELGHTFGLAHVDAPTVAVMRIDISGLSYTQPKLDDVQGIQHLY